MATLFFTLYRGNERHTLRATCDDDLPGALGIHQHMDGWATRISEFFVDHKEAPFMHCKCQAFSQVSEDGNIRELGRPFTLHEIRDRIKW